MHQLHDLERLSRPSFTKRGYVYFAERISDSAIKIGFSTQVAVRLRQHGWGRRPEPVRFIGALEGTVRLERELHRWFSADRPRTKYNRIAREWFLPTQTLRDWIGVFATTDFDDMGRPVPLTRTA